MEGIFFAINEIWWLNPIAWWSILLSLIWGICIIVSLEYKVQKKKWKEIRPLQQYSFKTIDSADPDYAQKTLLNIRKYLAHQYEPRHSWAHIPLDIQKYTNDSELIDIIEKLEKIEFSGKVIESNIQESINQALIKKL